MATYNFILEQFILFVRKKWRVIRL